MTLTGSFPPPGLVAYDIKVAWESSVFVFQSCSGTCNGSGGSGQAAGAFATGQTGSLVLGSFTLRAVGSSGQCANLIIQINELIGGGNTPFSVPVNNGRVCIS